MSRLNGVSLTSVGLARPTHVVEQAEAARWIAARTGDERRVMGLARRTRIARRSLALSAEHVGSLGSAEERNKLYQRIAPGLSVEAANRALGATSPSDIDCLITSSCTGYMVPGWAVELVSCLGLRGDVSRTPITEAGCAGGVVGLSRAADYLLARQGGSALVVATEVCSVAYQQSSDDDAVLANMLFADGSGAAVLSYGDSPGLQIVDMASVLVPDSRELLGFDLTDLGFSAVINRKLTGVLAPAAARAASELLERNNLQPADVSSWLLHPGGARILIGLEDALAFDCRKSRWSWQSLAECGNTSSAAIFDVISRYLDDSTAPAGNAVVMAFGPGVSIELMLARRAW